MRKNKSKYLKGCDIDWNLNHELILFLNDQLKIYKEKAKIDLTFHTFKYKHHTYTQEELIDYLIYITDHLINTDDWYAAEYFNKYNEVWDIWKILHPAMWW